MGKDLAGIGKRLRRGEHWPFIRDVGSVSLLRLIGGLLLCLSQMSN